MRKLGLIMMTLGACCAATVFSVTYVRYGYIPSHLFSTDYVPGILRMYPAVFIWLAVFFIGLAIFVRVRKKGPRK